MNVYLPKDRITNNHQGYGFVEFRTEEDADYVSAPSSYSLTCQLCKAIELSLIQCLALSEQHGMLGGCSLQAIKVLNMIKVYGKPIRVNKASQDKRTQDVGANMFIGNLDPEVDEKVCMLHACLAQWRPGSTTIFL